MDIRIEWFYLQYVYVYCLSNPKQMHTYTQSTHNYFRRVGVESLNSHTHTRRIKTYLGSSSSSSLQ